MGFTFVDIFLRGLVWWILYGLFGTVFMYKPPLTFIHPSNWAVVLIPKIILLYGFVAVQMFILTFWRFSVLRFITDSRSASISTSGLMLLFGISGGLVIAVWSMPELAVVEGAELRSFLIRGLIGSFLGLWATGLMLGPMIKHGSGR